MKAIAPIIFIILSISIFVFFTNPRYQAMQILVAEQRQLVEANDKARALRAERDRLTTDRKKIRVDDENRLLKMLPNSVENVGLVIDIDNIAKLYGMTIRNTKVSEIGSRANAASGPDSKKYGSIALSFTVTSDYNTFISFLRDLESSLRLVDVTALSFSTARDGRYDFNITLQTYWLK